MSYEFKAEEPEKLFYQEIANADPLNLDNAIFFLPQLNKDGNTEVIKEILFYSLNASKNMSSQTEAIASLRDIDFLAGSLIRHGIDPLTCIPGMEEELLRLGNIAETAPRGTVFTYAVVNPAGNRQRTFTGSVEEIRFIEATKEGVLALDHGLNALSLCFLANDEELGLALQNTSIDMDQMISSILRVRRNISPEYFTNEIRPYFEPLIIDGKKIAGAGGAQMQLLAIDRILWGVNDVDKDYQKFFTENLLYLTPMQRSAVNRFLDNNGNKSITFWLENNPGKFDRSREGALSLLNKIRKFRYPHRKVAQDNFKIRPKDSLGSGLYNTDILDILISKTENATRRIEESAYE